jgi:ribonucleoside-diphosphate reductase alpha chain
VLPGFTYKLKWQASDHAIYVTMNDIERDGRRRPFEIFINTKNLEHYAWTVALTRMISAVFRRGGDVTFVVEELKAVFDPQGGQLMGGRYVPSLLAAIGEVIEAHMIRIGFLAPPDSRTAVLVPDKVGLADGPRPSSASELREARPRPPAPRRCPKCQGDQFLPREGCNVCGDCGYSTCG